MPLIKRFFYIPCRGDECLRIAELIREKSPQTELLSIDVREDGLYITMYGYKTDVKNAWEFIRKTISLERSAIRTSKGGLKRINIEYLVKKKRKTFPPILLAEILKRMRHKVMLSQYKDEIATDAPLELVEELIDKIWEIMASIRYDVRGISAKYFVIAASILAREKPSNVIEKAVSLGLMGKDEEGKYRLKRDWRKAINDYLNTSKTV